MSWSSVIVAPHAGSPSTYIPTGSLSLSLPSRWSMRIAVAVNCFDTDAMSKRVDVVSGAPVARSARRPAPAHFTVPSTATAAEHPGLVAGTSATTARSLDVFFSCSAVARTRLMDSPALRGAAGGTAAHATSAAREAAQSDARATRRHDSTG